MLNDRIIWEDIKEVVIYHTSDVDCVFATRIAYETIRTKYNITNITLKDITTQWPVPAVAENPRNNLMVVFIGRIPNMVFIDQTIELVGSTHTLVLLNDDVLIDYFYNYSFRKDMCGLMIKEATLYELSYLYFIANARFCDLDCYHTVMLGNCMTMQVNGSGPSLWLCYRAKAVESGGIRINEAFNHAIQSAEVRYNRYSTADDINLYFGIMTVIPSITDSDAEFWQEIYKDCNSTEESTMISVYTTLGKSCRHMMYKDNIHDFKNFAFVGNIRKYTQFSAVALNTPFQGVWTFCRDEIYNHFHIGVEFCYNGLMHYKLYRLGKDPEIYVPIKNIAKSYGGNGNDYRGYFRTNGVLEILNLSKL